MAPRDLTQSKYRENASIILDEYYQSVGGREKVFEDMKNALKNKKRGRPSTNTSTAGNKRARKSGVHPGDTSPPASARQAAWKPPAGSWENEIAALDAAEDEEQGKLMVYLTWKNGHRTQHDTSVIYKRCPQKVRQAYTPPVPPFGVIYLLTMIWPADAAVLREACPHHQKRPR